MSQDHIKQDIASRPRKVDLEGLPAERVDEISTQIGQKIGTELGQVAEKIKRMLSVYGLDMKISYVLFPVGQDPVEMFARQQAAATKPATKKGSKKRKAARTA